MASSLQSQDHHEIEMQFRVLPAAANEHMALRNLALLLMVTYMKDGKDIHPTDHHGGFFEYSAKYWVAHTLLAKPATELVHKIKTFLISDKAVFWLKWRMQASEDVWMTIRALEADAAKLNVWMATASFHDKQPFDMNISDLVTTLYARWHQRLASAKAAGEVPDPRTFYTSSTTLGLLYFGMGNYTKAAQTLEQNHLPDENPTDEQLADVLRNNVALALVKTRQGRTAEAIQLQRKAIKHMELSPHTTKEERMTAAENLGNMLIRHSLLLDGNAKVEIMAEAEDLLTTLLEQRRKLLGNEHFDTLSSQQRLARLYVAQKRFPKATEVLMENLELTKKVLGAENRCYHTTLQLLGEVLEGSGDLEQAETTYREVNVLQRLALGENHPDIMDSAWAVGVVQQKRGDYHFAIETFKSLGPMNDATHGPYSRLTLNPIMLIGEMYVLMGEHAQAIPFLERVVNTCDREQENGKTHAQSVVIVRKAAGLLATAYEAQGMKGKASRLREVDWQAEMSLGPQSY